MSEDVTVDDDEDEDLDTDFDILWREYACCDPCMLTRGALRLRERLLDKAYAAHARVKELEGKLNATRVLTSDMLANADVRNEELEAENARLKGLIDADPVIKRIEYTPEDGVTAELSHWAVRHIAASLLNSFKEIGGENFFTLTVRPPVETDPDGVGPLEVTVRRCWKKKTPAMLIAELRAEVEALKAARNMGGDRE